MNCVIDMDLGSPSPQELRDHDERFRVPTPPPPLPPLPPLSSESIYTQLHTSLTLNPTLSNEPNKLFDDPDFNNRCHKLVEQLKSSNLLATTKSELIIPTEEAVFKACFGQSESPSSSENSLTDDNHPLVINENLPSVDMMTLPLVQDDSNRSLNEFVKLLTKEAYVSKSSSPTKKQDNPKHRRRSHEDNEKNNSSNHSNDHRHYTHSSDKKSQ
jgi:hypothetical protein